MHNKGRTESVNNLTKDTWPAAKFQDISNHNVMMDSVFTCYKKMAAVPILFLIINSCNKLGFNVQSNVDSNYSQQRCYWQFSTCTVYKTRIGVHFYAEFNLKKHILADQWICVMFIHNCQVKILPDGDLTGY